MADETKDVKISFEKRVNAQPGTFAIDWQGTGFDTDTVTEWIEPRLLGYSGASSRKSARTEFCTAQFNLYVRVSEGSKTTHDVWELIDAVLAAFDQFDMEVKNWGAGGGSTVGYLRFEEAAVVPVPGGGGRTPESGNLQQFNVTIPGVLIT